jgi:K+-transporting ATPase ATPase C chain
MFSQIVPSIRATLVLAILTGLVFPLVITMTAQLFLPDQANGSLVRNSEGKIVGSRLIGQQFTKAEYFHPRPSAAGAGYDGIASGGTNLGPSSKKLILGQADDSKTKDTDETFVGVKQLVEQYRKENDLAVGVLIPVDAVTRSGSGLDPDISLNNALLQAPRIAKARKLPLNTVRDLVHQHTEDRQLGVLGEPRVNVLLLNLALDELK